MSTLPLTGIRVVDFTWLGAGSYATKLLSDFGADVIKIESAEHIDTLRISRPFKDGIAGVNRSGYFSDRNSNKRSVTLNMKHPACPKLVKKLVAISDVVANNFSPGTMEKFGLGYDVVTAIRPDIVYLSMSMQGATGPEHKYLGYGLTIGALTGLQYLSGLPEREPAGTGTNYPDHIPNPCHAAFAVLAALRHRRRTGQGQFIDVAQTEPTIALLGPTLMDYTVNGVNAGRTGNARPHAAPHGTYPCAGDDRWVAISVRTAAEWRGLLQVFEVPTWMREPGLDALHARLAARERIDTELTRLTASREADQLMHVLQESGVPAGVVRTAREIVDVDPQLRHREHNVRLAHPEVGSALYNAPPFRLSGMDPTPQRAAPLLGQHTDEVLRDILGLADAEVQSLRSEGALQ